MGLIGLLFKGILLGRRMTKRCSGRIEGVICSGNKKYKFLIGHIFQFSGHIGR